MGENKAKLDKIFFDVETSGLDVREDEIIEIAAIRTTPDFEIIATATEKVQFQRPIDEETTSVNGYSPDAWKNAVPFVKAISSIRSKLIEGRSNRYVVVAHYSQFDEAMLRNQCRREQIDFPFEGRAWVDTTQLAWILVEAGCVVDRKLATLANYYDIPIHKIHSADGDCSILLHIYQRMMTRFEIGMQIESKGREVVGKATQGVMELVNNYFGKGTRDGKEDKESPQG